MCLTPPGPYRATTCRERELTLDRMHTFFTTQVHGVPPRMRDQLYSGATSETTRTWKMTHTIHSLIHSNKANIKGWLWRSNDIRGLCGPKASRDFSYRWGKTPKKPHPGNSSRPEIEPGPAAWQARMLLSAPQRWTYFLIILEILNNSCIIINILVTVSNLVMWWRRLIVTFLERLNVRSRRFTYWKSSKTLGCERHRFLYKKEQLIVFYHWLS